MRTIADLITKIFNPTTSAIAGILVVVTIQQIPASQKLLWLVLGFLVIAVPLAVFYFGYRRGDISSFWSPKGSERVKAFGVWVGIALIFAIAAYLLKAPRLVTALGLVLLVLGIINLITAASFKISIHCELITLFVLLAILAVSVNLIYLAILIPLVGWSRIYLKAHTISEVSLGTLTAVLAVYLVFAFFGLATF